MADFGEVVNQFSNFRKGAITSEQKGEGDYQWLQYETPLWIYEKEFKRLLPSITEFLSNRKQDKPTFALDFMSGGQAIRDLAEKNAITAGVSITLNDFRKPDIKANDSSLDAEVISGNILYGTKTRELKNWIKSKNSSHPYFDLIMCNAGNGFVSFRSGRLGYGLVENIFWQGIDLLDPNGGIMLTYIPDIFRERDKVFKWVDRINKAKVGLDLKHDTPYGHDGGQYILRVTRNQQSNNSFDPSKKQQYKQFSKGL